MYEQVDGRLPAREEGSSGRLKGRRQHGHLGLGSTNVDEGLSRAFARPRTLQSRRGSAAATAGRGGHDVALLEEHV